MSDENIIKGYKAKRVKATDLVPNETAPRYHRSRAKYSAPDGTEISYAVPDSFDLETINQEIGKIRKNRSLVGNFIRSLKTKFHKNLEV